MYSILLLFLRIGIHFKTIPETVLLYVSIFIFLTSHILVSFVLVPSVSRVTLAKRSILLLLLCFQSWTVFCFNCLFLSVLHLLLTLSLVLELRTMLKWMACGGNWLIFLRTLSGGLGAFNHGGREHNSNCLDCHWKRVTKGRKEWWMWFKTLVVALWSKPCSFWIYIRILAMQAIVNLQWHLDSVRLVPQYRREGSTRNKNTFC